MISSAIPDLTAAFLAGIFGSLHCIGMCGPLASLGCRSGLSRRSGSGPLWFVIGKLGSYAVLGLIVGLIGMMILQRGGTFGRAVAWGSIVGGVLMLLILILSRVSPVWRSAGGLSTSMAKLSLKAGPRAPLFLGMAAALLPCGLLYAMVARSAAAGDPVLSMGLMVAFGAGTSPALLGIGTLLRMIPEKWSRYGAIAGEIVLALTAIALIWRGWMGLVAAATGHSCCH